MLRDQETGEWVQKPSPPSLRMVRKGGWAYEELEPQLAQPEEPVASSND
jgi:hypothetical protein